MQNDIKDALTQAGIQLSIEVIEKLIDIITKQIEQLFQQPLGQFIDPGFKDKFLNNLQTAELIKKLMEDYDKHNRES